MSVRAGWPGWAAAGCGVAGLFVGLTAMGGVEGTGIDPFWAMALLGAGAVVLAFVAVRQGREERGRPWAAALGLVAGGICLVIALIGLAVTAVFGALVDFFF